MIVDLSPFEEIVVVTKKDEYYYSTEDIKSLDMDGTTWKFDLNNGGFILIPHTAIQKIEFFPKGD